MPKIVSIPRIILVIACISIGMIGARFLDSKPQQNESFGKAFREPPENAPILPQRAVEQIQQTTDPERGSNRRVDADPGSNNVILGRLKQIVDLKSKGSKGMVARIPLLDSNRSLSPAFVDLFGLTEKEAGDIRATIFRAVEEIENHARSSSTIVSEEPAKLTVEIQPHPDAERIRTLVNADLEAVLGSERMAAFESLERDELLTITHDFGVSTRRLIITAFPSNAASATPNVLYDIRMIDGKSVSKMYPFKELSSLPRDFAWLDAYQDKLSVLGKQQ